jgi:hypothetical protein
VPASHLCTGLIPVAFFPGCSETGCLFCGLPFLDSRDSANFAIFNFAVSDIPHLPRKFSTLWIFSALSTLHGLDVYSLNFVLLTYHIVARFCQIVLSGSTSRKLLACTEDEYWTALNSSGRAAHLLSPTPPSVALLHSEQKNLCYLINLRL